MNAIRSGRLCAGQCLSIVGILSLAGCASSPPSMEGLVVSSRNQTLSADDWKDAVPLTMCDRLKTRGYYCERRPSGDLYVRGPEDPTFHPVSFWVTFIHPTESHPAALAWSVIPLICA